MKSEARFTWGKYEGRVLWHVLRDDPGYALVVRWQRLPTAYGLRVILSTLLLRRLVRTFR